MMYEDVRVTSPSTVAHLVYTDRVWSGHGRLLGWF
jgi:hypothetical protein